MAGKNLSKQERIHELDVHSRILHWLFYDAFLASYDKE